MKNLFDGTQAIFWFSLCILVAVTLLVVAVSHKMISLVKNNLGNHKVTLPAVPIAR